MLEVHNLSVSYGKGLPQVLSDLSFSLDKGGILNVLGQNAVGKTTLIKCLVRELSDYSGCILLHNRDIRLFSIKEYSKNVGVVSATFNAYQNLLVADYLTTGFLNQTAVLARPTSAMIEEAFSALERFGKQELFTKQVDQLSSGEKQLVMISRIILQNPEVIIVDEPTANLDVKNQIAVLEQIQKLSELGYTIITTTHNPGHALCLGGKTLLMGAGKYVFGKTKEIINSQNLANYYDLRAAMLEASGLQCIVFSREEDDRIKLVF